VTAASLTTSAMPAAANDGPVAGDAGSQLSRLLDTVVRGGYCVGCGACAAVTQSPLRMQLNEFGAYVPAIAEDAGAGTQEALVAGVCPFYTTGLDEDSLTPAVLTAGARHDPDVGHYRNVYAGHAIEGNFRQDGSSGGLTNWLAAELLTSGMVDGIIHVTGAARPTPGGVLVGYTVSHTVRELGRGSKSRYYPVEMSAAIQLMREQPGRYAFIGVPCFVKAIRLLARTDAVIGERVRYCIALFCGHLKSRAFAEYTGWQLGIAPNELVDFDFRTKDPDRPANRYAVTATGLRRGEFVTATAPTQELDGSDWGQGFFKLKACDYCEDIVGETADVSLGDAWLPEYVSDGRGTNIVVTRHPDLQVLLAGASNGGRITLQPLPAGDVRRSQQSNFRHRRDDLAYRLWLADRQGHWRPAKRVAADAEGVASPRKRVIEQRMALRDGSHQTFALAKSAAADFGFISRRLAGAVSAYLQAVATERRIAQSTQAMTVPVQPQSAVARWKNLGRYYRLRALAEYHSVIRRLRPVTGSALIIPPATPGGVGDDAMLSALVGALRERSYAKIDIGELQVDPQRRYRIKVDGHFNLSTVLNASASPAAISDFLHQSRRYIDIFIIGADILDGYYSEKVSTRRIELADWAHKAGIRVTFTGFSFNAKPKPSAVAAMRRLSSDVRLCVRDPVSVERVKKSVGRDPLTVADVAFLLKPEPPQDAELMRWLGAEESVGQAIIGVNAIYTSKFFGERSEQAQDQYILFHINLIRRIARDRPNCRFLLIPHDYRPRGIGEGPLLEQIFLSLDDHLRARTLLLRREYSGAEIKWLCSRLDFVVTSRMHLAIASLGQGIPVFCFTYQGKFEGLFKLLNHPELVTSMDEVLGNPDRLLDRILDIYADAPRVRASLYSSLPRILKLAQRNIPY
jgi:coenzyme F420 hydrogenase subunit beta